MHESGAERLEYQGFPQGAPRRLIELVRADRDSRRDRDSGFLCQPALHHRLGDSTVPATVEELEGRGAQVRQVHWAAAGLVAARASRSTSGSTARRASGSTRSAIAAPPAWRSISGSRVRNRSSVQSSIGPFVTVS